MAIELVRIDDRLIHGQVATSWVNDHKIAQILIINDAIKEDNMQQSIIMMTAPNGVEVKIFGVQQFIDIMKKTEIKKRTMLIMTSPKDVYALIESGIVIKHLNIGGMRFGDNRKKLSSSVFTTLEDEEYFRKMIAMGVVIEIQLIPRSEAISLANLL